MAVGTLLCLAVLFWTRQAATTAALTSLQQQCAELRSQIETRDQNILDLRATIERLQHSTAPVSATIRATQPHPATGTETELTLRMAELTVLQSNTLALLEKLMARAANLPPEESPQQKKAGLAALELSVAEFRQKVDAAKQRTAELLVTLNIPTEISTMDPSKALATASLQPYWPFFDAVREREHMVYLMEKVQARLLQEQIDAKAAAEKSKSQ